MYRQPSIRLQNNTPKLAGKKTESISQEAIYQETLAMTSSRYQVFAKLLWKSSEDASQMSSLNQMSLPKITRSSESFSTVPSIVNGGDWGCNVRDYHSLGLSRIQFHPQKVTPLTNPAKDTDQGLCYCNPDAWGWPNSHQSGVISITDQLILQNGKKLRSVQEEQ